ncbi:MAG TPA: energy transducer TonB [Chthoniobacterales bacterium]|nr:energy transducer TonB [Chthoniobacterales bacterium]
MAKITNPNPPGAKPGPLLYKGQPRWQVWLAIGGALAIHGIAAVIAGLKPEPPPAVDIAQLEQIAEVTFETAEPEPTPPPEEMIEPEPVDAPPEPTEVPEFVEEKPTPPPKRDKPPKPVAPIARPKPAGVAGPMSMSSAKAVAVSAPRPEYPYEARRSKITGSGVCVMDVDPSSGAVTSATMAVSTGNPILDNAATSAFRRWRFKPGTVSKVRTPITFTMTGAQY